MVGESPCIILFILQVAMRMCVCVCVCGRAYTGYPEKCFQLKYSRREI